MNNIEYLRAQEERLITLNEWCQAYYNCDIIQYPNEVVNYVHKIAKKTIELQNNAIKEARRVNEQGNDTEKFLLEAIKEIFGGEFNTLGNAYPDIKGSTPLLEYPLIVDSKIRKNLKIGDSLRIFYTSTPKTKTTKKKALQTSHHLLFLFEHDGNQALNGNYRVVDLFNFQYVSKGRIQEGSYNDILAHNKFIAEKLS
jgi:hypothetical protein